MKTIAYSELMHAARSVGLELFGAVNLPVSLIREEVKLESWQQCGFAGEMEYMNRSPEIFVDPNNLLKNARSVISFAVQYSPDKKVNLPKGHGRVARYAWGKDYHKVLKKRLKQVISLLGLAENEARVVIDAAPLLEKAVAANSGLGFVGKNTLLIKKGTGSYTLLGEIITTLEVKELPLRVIEEGCGTCMQCITSCPTGAITQPYTIDARRCISYLTIEKRGLFTIDEIEMVGEWIFGCDACQEVCPYNHAPSIKNRDLTLEEFQPHNGIGPFLNLEDVLQIATDEEYLDRFKGTPLMRPKREGLLRNACCVAFNTREKHLKTLLKYLSENDRSPVVRDTARWCCDNL